MTSPSVTIGITAYNAEASIAAALQSALAQSYPLKQIVIVDDCSTDGTWALLQQLANDPRIELAQNPVNSGVAVSRNEIIKRASGDIIAFFDDDDVSDPHRVALQVERIVRYEQEFANGAPVICHTARRQIYPDGSERIEPAMGAVTGKIAPHGPAVARRTLAGDPLEDAYGSCATCSQAAQRSVYEDLGGFDPALRRCEDSDIAIRLAKAGGHFVGLAEPLVTQHMTPTSDKALDALRDFNLRLLDKHRDVFVSEQEYRFCRDWITLKYKWLGGGRLGFATGLLSLGVRRPAQTVKRLWRALPNVGGNLSQRQFQRSVG